MELVEEVIDENTKVHFRFQFTTQPGRHILQLENVSKAYGDKQILKDTTISIERGDKIALIGANGKGKSTALRIVAGTEEIEGVRRLGHNVAFTFYAQHQLESLNLENNLIEELKYANPSKTEASLRTVLGCFLFTGDDVFKKIKVLSGGEKSRVALAKVLLSQANFLLLDEPTNHLDMQSVNILIQALQQYEGSYIVVSHDRYFVESIANKIWYIEDQQIKEYPGTYAEYCVWLEDRIAQITEQPEPRKKVESKENKPSRTPDESKIKRNQLQKKAEELEAEITRLEKEKRDWEAKLATPEVYSDSQRLGEANKSYAEVSQRLEEATEEWAAVMQEAETL